RDAFPRETELPFDSDRKLMSTVNSFQGTKLMLTKGGPDVMFNRISHVLIQGEERPITNEIMERLQQSNEDFSNQALRVLAYGYKRWPEGKSTILHEDEYDLILVGLTAMMDPPREAVYDSIEQSKQAGIRTIMITGDH